MCISAEFSTEFFYETILAARNNLHQVYPIRAVKSEKGAGTFDLQGDSASKLSSSG